MDYKAREAINAAIQAVEKSSSGELVVVSTEQSGDYRAASLALAIITSIVVSILFWWFAPMSNYIELCAIQLFCLALTEWILQETGLILYVIPASMKIKAASRNAKAQFVEHGLYTTESRAAILIFVSLKERYIEIIPDIGIRNRVGDQVWQAIALESSKLLRAGKTKVACLYAIIALSHLLTDHYPVKNNNKDELPNIIAN